MSQDTTTSASAQEMLDRMEQFFRHYLHCSPDQRAVLQIWALHTHCFAAANATPYLFIHSPEKQSGKTLCLQLLNLLCAGPWLATAVTPAMLAGKITAERPTVLLDDCHTIFSPAARARTCALLMNGSRRGGTFSLAKQSAIHDLHVFCPKALAGDFLLPLNIVEHFIPIALMQNFDYGYFRKFRLYEASEMAAPLVESMKAWAAANLDALGQAPPFPYDDFELRFSPREQDCREPLFQIACLLGGDWPSRLAAALNRIYSFNFRNDLLHRVYLLSDIRDLFDREEVQRLATRQILEYLHGLEERPWNEWNNGRPMNASDLAQLLRRWGIEVRSQRHDSGQRGQGYDRNDFTIHCNAWLPEHDARMDARFAGPPQLE